MCNLRLGVRQSIVALRGRAPLCGSLAFNVVYVGI